MSFYAEVFSESRLTAQLWFDDFFGVIFFVVRPNKHMHLDILSNFYTHGLLQKRDPERPSGAVRQNHSDTTRRTLIVLLSADKVEGSRV